MRLHGGAACLRGSASPPSECVCLVLMSLLMLVVVSCLQKNAFLCWLLNLEALIPFEHKVQSLSNACPLGVCVLRSAPNHTPLIYRCPICICYQSRSSYLTHYRARHRVFNPTPPCQQWIGGGPCLLTNLQIHNLNGPPLCSLLIACHTPKGLEDHGKIPLSLLLLLFWEVLTTLIIPITVLCVYF